MPKVMKPKTQSISGKKAKEAIQATKVARILALRAAKIGTEIPRHLPESPELRGAPTADEGAQGKDRNRITSRDRGEGEVHREGVSLNRPTTPVRLTSSEGAGLALGGRRYPAPTVRNRPPTTTPPSTTVIDIIANPPLEEKLTVTQSEMLTYSLPAPKPTSTKTPKPLNTKLTYNACWGHALIENHKLSKDAETHIQNVLKDQTPKFKWLWPFLSSKAMELDEHAQFTHFDKTKYGGDIRWSSLNLDTLLQNQIQITNTVLEAFMALYSDYQWKDLRNRLASHRIHVSFFHVFFSQ
jgi:hypothetical protein